MTKFTRDQPKWRKGARQMNNQKLKVCSNAADIDTSKIPQSAINDLANTFYKMMLHKSDRQRQEALKEKVS